MPRQPESVAAEVDEVEAKRQRKAAKRAAKEAAVAEEEVPVTEVDEEEAKRQRKAAKKAAKLAAASVEVAEEEIDEEAKKQKKAAKKAAKQAAVADEAGDEVDEEEAKRQRKAEKKLAKQAAAAATAAEEDEPMIPAKSKKRSVEATDEDAEEEEVPQAKKTKTVADDTAATDDVNKSLKVFIKGLPYSTTEDALRKDFAECGEIMSLQLPMNEEGRPKGFAFIVFATQEGFDAALKYDNTDYGGRYIGVSKANGEGAGKAKGKGKDGDWECPNCGDNVFARNSACRKCGTAKPGGADKVGQDNENTVFIRGLPWSVTEETLRKDFAECGEIEKLTFPLNEEGKPKGISFIKYKTQEGVDAALKFDSTDYAGRSINVCKAGEGKGKGKGKDGKDGKGKGKDGKSKGKDGKGKAKGKGKVTSESKAKSSGCIVAAAGEKKTFADSDDE